MTRIIFYIVLFAVTSIMGSCKKEHTDSDPLKPVGEIIPVMVSQVQLKKISKKICLTGLISTEDEARLSFKIGGVIDKVFFEEGDFFKRGDLLATLKFTEITAQLEQAELALEKSKRDLERVTNLYKDSVATLEEFQNSKTAVDVAEKTVELLSFNRQHASIISSTSGFVAKKTANDGEVVSAGSPILIVNNSDSHGWILNVGASDKEWASLSSNQKAEIEVDGYPGKKFSGYVLRKSLAADPFSGSFQVEIKVMFTGEKPAVGMFGRACIKSKMEVDVVSIPYDAVIEADGNHGFVFVPGRNNSVKKIAIRIESFDGDQVIIGSGLQGIDTVIIGNAPFLNEQSVISIQ